MGRWEVISPRGKKEEKKEEGEEEAFIVERGMQGYEKEDWTTEWLRG